MAAIPAVHVGVKNLNQGFVLFANLLLGLGVFCFQNFDCATLCRWQAAGAAVAGIPAWVLGRVLAKDAIDETSGELVVEAGIMLDERLVEKMESAGVEAKMHNKQIIALIAYLQRLGKDMGGK